MTRVAAIDCGTNSIRLLVADIDPAGRLMEVDRRLEIVRLGQEVDRTGRFDPVAIERAFTVCREYGAVIESHGTKQVRFVATSATRDAANREVFLAGIRKILGVEPEVISGSEEAELSFGGATRSLRASRRADPPPYLVVDIGGGSTEFVLGRDHAEAARSVDLGCVRLTERHLDSDPPTPGEVARARETITAGLDLVADVVPVERTKTLIGLAGSVTTVAAIALGLERYDPVRIHHSRISAFDVKRVTDELLTMSHRERLAIPAMHPGRADVIGAGALILAEIMDRVGVPDVVVSEHDILDGIAWSIPPHEGAVTAIGSR